MKCEKIKSLYAAKLLAVWAVRVALLSRMQMIASVSFPRFFIRAAIDRRSIDSIVSPDVSLYRREEEKEEEFVRVVARRVCSCLLMKIGRDRSHKHQFTTGIRLPTLCPFCLCFFPSRP